MNDFFRFFIFIDISWVPFSVLVSVNNGTKLTISWGQIFEGRVSFILDAGDDFAVAV